LAECPWQGVRLAHAFARRLAMDRQPRSAASLRRSSFHCPLGVLLGPSLDDARGTTADCARLVPSRERVRDRARRQR
jgi:hypothetical protein